MKIEITTRTKQKKVIDEFQLPEELQKILLNDSFDTKEVIMKLDRGDLLGFNDIHFKKYNMDMMSR